MPRTDTRRALRLLDTSTDGGGCSCGGCGCGSSSDARSSADTSTAPTTAAMKEISMTTHTYDVTGMTCGHCTNAVIHELTALEGVTEVSIDLVAGGASSVTVTSTQPLDDAQVASALDEAGEYQLA